MKLRGAISGFGEVAARAHLPGWRSRENLAINVVHDPISERRHEAIRLIKGVRVYDDLDLMLDGEAPDFVDIASPPALHADAATRALNAGAHVLVEKPMCLTLADFERLLGLARSKGRILMCVHNWKHAPAYATARRAIRAGRLGRVHFISIDRMRTSPAGGGGSGAQWRSGAASGGGILIDHGWHIFYLMRWLMNDTRPSAVSARLQFPDQNDVDDVADVRATFADRRLARAHLTWRAPVRRTSAAIYGDLGCLEIEGDRVIFTTRDGAHEDLSTPDDADDSYHSAWFSGVAADFECAIAEGPNSPIAATNLAEARDALAMIEAARESSNRGGTDVALK